MTPDCSVVIVTFESMHEIDACLKSVHAELTGQRAQIIVVDNNSNDATIVVVRQFIEKIKSHENDIKLIINDENVGFTRALNIGLRKALGKVVLILNPDTELKPGCFDKLLQVLQSDEKIGAVAPQLLNSDGSVQLSCRRFPRRQDVFWEITGLSYLFPKNRIFNYWKMGDFDHKTSRLVEQPQGAFLMIKRHLLEVVGYWDERFFMFFSDVDWCKQLKDNGYKIVFVAEAQAKHHRGVSVQKNRVKMIWSSHRSFYQYFQKHETKSGIPLANEFLGIILWITGAVRVLFFILFGKLLKRTIV